MGDMADFTNDSEPVDYIKFPQVTQCKFCGEKGLEWHLVNGTWRLQNTKGIHACEAYHMKKFLFKGKNTSIHKPVMNPPAGLKE